MTVQAESFHLNGHIRGFRPQTQKLASSYQTPPSTLAVKGLKVQLSTMDMSLSLEKYDALGSHAFS